MKHLLKISLITIFTLGVSFSAMSVEKKVLNHTNYDSWKSIDKDFIISHNGKFISYVISPQIGDSYLYIYDVANGKLDSIPRGKTPQFSVENDFVAFNVKAQNDSIRALKLKKTKKDKLPKDSLFIKNLISGDISKIPNLKSWKLPEDGGNWLAYMIEKKKEEPKDTAEVKEKGEKSDKKDKDKKAKEFKSEGNPLVLYRPVSGDSLFVEKVSFYEIANNGSGAYLVQSTGDTTEVSKVLRFDAQTFTIDTIFKKIGKIEKLASDYTASQCAFLFSDDTSKVKVDQLYYYRTKLDAPNMILDTIDASLPSEWSALSKGELNFSRDGSKLFFGAGKRPHEEPKDTLTDDEKIHVDVWNWKDIEIQPMQKKNLKKDKDPAYKCVYLVKQNKIVQLESKDFRSVKIPDRGNSNIGFSYVSTPYKRAQSWSGRWSNDIYKVDILTGQKQLIEKDINGTSEISKSGKWLVYYDQADSAYYAYNTLKGSKSLISKGVKISWVDELNDSPTDADAYGIVDFTKDDKSVIVYDRFDIWQLDLSGKLAPVCLTNSLGRKLNTSFRVIKLDKDELFIDINKELLLRSFNEINKQSGFYSLNKNKTEKIIEGDYNIYNPLKAKNAETYIWRKSTFKSYPELRISDKSFNHDVVISNTNPQQKDFNWGDIQLVDWVASDGLKHQGLLITPEDLDTSKKYPMISYFYERYSDELHKYYRPAPSRSTVNWSFYASNGYVLFIPDIFYRTGDPGLCAYEAVVSGSSAMADRFSFIDRDHMGIQGQSWGGYQVAFLVTRTNLFKAAMAGAPVSNMTSAYGGIRWGTGMSRMFQYEHTQSRIGGTLWNKMNKYIENSPVFFAPQVETPLLIMHNDNDGAVPWYQGIEYFMALRRLNKPAWLLVYNNEEHNLTRRANSKDLSRRMMQFFDHYLKEKAIPVWMNDGVPAIKKGEDLGYDLVEE
ncbi:S9 family peptidase [Plebeiibacterium sediminum]|uniref:Prolyl oligopeptidase family serine peptidase n=1 Tax=Plebeiibacterium sediminum TaxID=2992112 RepID=A0AAE3M905_9BACT|nr:prolyl oligopeptidase family serine peptidase [Plebeiobacterium sediminum]MCW3789187.1 prolyl oligopeptidase family serine peptidase [Plebeiobacterium sediminum]